jgi:rhamnogalacturonyl hydrolase YesR
MKTHSTSSASRPPLDVAAAIAARFMKIQRESLDYMYGVGLRGILDLYEATQDRKYLDFCLSYAGRKPRFDLDLYRATGDPRWLTGAAETGEKFLAEPRRDREGALLDPRGRYTVDVLSGLFTYPVLLGHVLKDHRFFDEAQRQFEIHQSYLEDPLTGAWYSRWGHSLHPNRNNPGLWARGNGWLVAAWARVMHLWDSRHPGYRLMLAQWHHFCDSLAAFQTPSGLFRQLLNRSDCYEEASGSGLFCFAFAHGVRHSTLPKKFAPIAYRAFRGLAELTDQAGNVHNASMYAGGYNFERQYYSSARFNDPHGDGTVLSACVAVHRLLQSGLAFPKPAPRVKPAIVTQAVPGCVTAVPPKRRKATEVAPPVLRRALALATLPEHDLYGSTILGLAEWHAFSKAAAALEKAAALLGQAGARLPVAARWNLQLEIEPRRGAPVEVDALRTFVDGELASTRRDRGGLILDEAGGYSIQYLYIWLPLLAKTGALTGDRRYFDEACRQLLGHQSWLEDPLTRFWHSAFGHGMHPRRVTPGLWGLGNGYGLAGMVGLLEHLPRDHAQYIECLFLLRRFVEACHEYLPVNGGYNQILNDLATFRCVAATGLLAYGINKAIFMGWVQPEYYAAAYGSIHHLGEMIDGQGHYGASSLPWGGLDTLPDYEEHRAENDPASLGFVLMGCAQGALCENSGLKYDNADERLGAR